MVIGAVYSSRVKAASDLPSSLESAKMQIVDHLPHLTQLDVRAPLPEVDDASQVPAGDFLVQPGGALAVYISVENILPGRLPYLGKLFPGFTPPRVEFNRPPLQSPRHLKANSKLSQARLLHLLSRRIGLTEDLLLGFRLQSLNKALDFFNPKSLVLANVPHPVRSQLIVRDGDNALVIPNGLNEAINSFYFDLFTFLLFSSFSDEGKPTLSPDWQDNLLVISHETACSCLASLEEVSPELVFDPPTLEISYNTWIADLRSLEDLDAATMANSFEPIVIPTIEDYYEEGIVIADIVTVVEEESEELG
jgi:hypothetical protein